MGEMEKRRNLSKEAFDNTEKLIQSYVAEDIKKKTRKERNKITDEFTIAFNGMSMLMSELDRYKAIEMLDSYGLLDSIRKSVRRIQRNKSLAFI